MILKKVIQQEAFKPVTIQWTHSGIIVYQERFLPHQVGRQVIIIKYEICELLKDIILGNEKSEKIDQDGCESLHFTREFDGFYIMQNYIDKAKNTIPINMDAIFIHKKTINSFCESLMLLNKV